MELGVPHRIADDFVTSRGFVAIGFNWELLDAEASPGEPRSGEGEIVKALTGTLANPAKPWLAHDAATACAHDFLSLFEPPARTLLANRYDGLWNPIGGSATEWGFVGYDAKTIALLLLSER
jgi:hypothetical protein